MVGPPPRFPPIPARSLEREHYALPSDFEAPRTIAVVAFERRQQADVDGWLPLLLELERTHPDVRVYEIPVISWRWGPARWFIDGGMTAAIADRGARARTLTSYTDVGAVQRALGLRDGSSIATVLAARDGAISWMTLGPFTEHAGEELRRVLGEPGPR